MILSKSLRYVIEQKNSVSNETVMLFCKSHSKLFKQKKSSFSDILETKKGDTSIFHLLFDCTEASNDKCDAQYQVV